MSEEPICSLPEWLQELNLSSDTFSYHLKHPEIMPEEYIRSRHIKLGEEVLTKRRIYLDQKYWIYCRDVVRGNPQKSIHTKIYEVLKDGVSSGKILCPASHLILQETLKQKDLESRHLTATLVQELSYGITIQPDPVLFEVEIRHFVREKSLGTEKIYPCEQKVWTYIANVYGFVYPSSAAFDPETEKAFQKTWFDMMAEIQFPILVKRLSYPSTNLYVTPLEFYDQQNAACILHEKDFSSFKEVFLIELAGGLDKYKDTLSDSLIYLYKKNFGGGNNNIPKDDLNEVRRQFTNLVYHAFRLDKIGRELPGFRIMAGIHAAIRYKRQKYKKGDLEDHRHAMVALPYCDVFLTEKTLGHLLCDKPLEYDKIYGLRVAWEPEDALKAIEEVLEYPNNDSC